MISGKHDATLQELRLVDIHGTRFYDIVFTHDDAPGKLRTARIGVEDAYPGPQAGDAISVSYLMNIVTGITRR